MYIQKRGGKVNVGEREKLHSSHPLPPILRTGDEVEVTLDQLLNPGDTPCAVVARDIEMDNSLGSFNITGSVIINGVTTTSEWIGMNSSIILCFCGMYIRYPPAVPTSGNLNACDTRVTRVKCV